jgi:hypothetical protein
MSNTTLTGEDLRWHSSDRLLENLTLAAGLIIPLSFVNVRCDRLNKVDRV